MNTDNKLHGLTIFRFVSAFYVFLFHCNIRFPIDAPAWIERFIRNGAIGMTFFFVLSGFVMAWSSRHGLRKDYIKARILRIYPAYIFMGILTIPFLFEISTKEALSSVFLFTFGLQAWIPQTFPIWNFGGSWSVSVEIFFYFIFPIIFPLVLSKPIRCLSISILISALIIPIAMTFNDSNLFPSYYMIPIYRLPEFISGIAISVLLFKNRWIPNKKILLTLSTLAIFAIIFISTKNNDAFLRKNIVTLPMTLIIIYSLSVSNIAKNVFTSIFIYLGKISYSFYLMQLPIMMFFDRYKHLFNNYDTYLLWIVAAIINLGMSIISYHFIEERFSLKRRQV